MTVIITCYGMQRLLGSFTDSYCHPIGLDILLPLGLILLAVGVLRLAPGTWRRRGSIGIGLLLLTGTMALPAQMSNVPSHEERMNDITGRCSSLCTDIAATTPEGGSLNASDDALAAAVSYCTETFQLDTDEDGKYGLVREGYGSYCEDGLHCFNLQSCTVKEQTLTPGRCKDLLVQYLTTVGNETREAAAARVNDLYRPASDAGASIGSCGLHRLNRTTWYSDHFTAK